jgi:transposase
MASAGLNDKRVSEALHVSMKTVWGIRKRYVEEGLDAALNDRPRSGRASKLTEKQKARLIAIACGQAPDGHTHWTLRLLAEKAVQLGLTESICHETVRAILREARFETLAQDSSVVLQRV